MNTKGILVSVIAIIALVFLATIASAYTVSGNLADVYEVEVDGLSANLTSNISVVAGETISVKVSFESDVDASNVRVEAQIDGEKERVEQRTGYFDVEAGSRYVKTLNLEVPYELKDQVSDNLPLYIKIWNGDYKTEFTNIGLKVQRPSYLPNIMSVIASNTLKAGEVFPVDVVIKNSGYNDLEDLYITVKIAELGVEKTAYFGDLVSIEADSDDTDTMSGRLYLKVPYEAESGVYTLVVKAENSDTSRTISKEITVKNDFPETVIKTNSGLLIVNPTSELKVYRLVSPSDEQFVSVQAGSSKTVPVSATSDEYSVNLLTMDGKLVGSFVFTRGTEQLSSPIVVFTVILGIVFLVLLVVLVVLITKKPQKTEEFGESYY